MSWIPFVICVCCLGVDRYFIFPLVTGNDVRKYFVATRALGWGWELLLWYIHTRCWFQKQTHTPNGTYKYRVSWMNIVHPALQTPVNGVRTVHTLTNERPPTTTRDRRESSSVLICQLRHAFYLLMCWLSHPKELATSAATVSVVIW